MIALLGTQDNAAVDLTWEEMDEQSRWPTEAQVQRHLQTLLWIAQTYRQIQKQFPSNLDEAGVLRALKDSMSADYIFCILLSVYHWRHGVRWMPKRSATSWTGL